MVGQKAAHLVEALAQAGRQRLSDGGSGSGAAWGAYGTPRGLVAGERVRERRPQPAACTTARKSHWSGAAGAAPRHPMVPSLSSIGAPPSRYGVRLCATLSGRSTPTFPRHYKGNFVFTRMGALAWTWRVCARPAMQH